MVQVVDYGGLMYERKRRCQPCRPWVQGVLVRIPSISPTTVLSKASSESVDRLITSFG